MRKNNHGRYRGNNIKASGNSGAKGIPVIQAEIEMDRINTPAFFIFGAGDCLWRERRHQGKIPVFGNNSRLIVRYIDDAWYRTHSDSFYYSAAACRLKDNSMGPEDRRRPKKVSGCAEAAGDFFLSFRSLYICCFWRYSTHKQ